MHASLLFLSFFMISGFFPSEVYQISSTSNEPQYLYILAPNGLNMREGPTVSYDKLTKIPYGAKVELIVPSADKSIQVDGLRGGMAKISYEGYVGYAFDGYMSQFKAPQANMKVMDYVDDLRDAEHLVYYEKVERDYDGYFQFEESIIIHKSHWEEAFLVAKQLFNIPPKLHFPLKNMQTESTYVNPDKRDIAWTDELTVTRERGLVTGISYSYRAEGGGMAVSIAYFEPDSEAIKITQLSIAD